MVKGQTERVDEKGESGLIRVSKKIRKKREKKKIRKRKKARVMNVKWKNKIKIKKWVPLKKSLGHPIRICLIIELYNQIFCKTL